jgi:chromate transporter
METPSGSVSEVVRVFLKLGFTAFGGPAAHIGMFHEEIVIRRKWITEEKFLDLLGAVNLIPGPNSTEMTIHMGYLRAGWRGLILGGLCFILPAASIVLGLAWLYAEYGTLPTAESLLYGIKPVVIAIIMQALWGLIGKAAKNRLLMGVGVISFFLYLGGINEIALLFGCGLVVMLIENGYRLKQGAVAVMGLPFTLAVQTADAKVPYSLDHLFWIFLKIGAVLYGSGYVLLAFLRSDLVDRTGWLTEQQLLDAVAVGQFTPGPLFTTATFIGYLVGGVPGAVVATIGIFLPSFIFVAMTNPLIPHMRRSPWFGALLDGVNMAALGLMGGVTWQLGIAALTDVFTIVLALSAAGLLMRYKVNSIWLVLGGGILGIGYHLL